MVHNVLIWGLGNIYNCYSNMLKYCELAGQIKIVGITSNDMFWGSKVDGITYYRKSDLCNLQLDYIVVMNNKYFDEIVEEILSLGFTRKQIISYRVLCIPGFDFNEYIELVKSNITILSNNCWGGIIYNTLAIECLSPFKNLSVAAKEYIKVLNDLKTYMAYELRFEKFAIEPNINTRYPVMLLGDVEIHCNHDTDPDVAVEKWNRRVKKINYDNIFAEMYTEDAEIADMFCKLDYDKKVCFVPFDTSNNIQIQLHMWQGMKKFWEAVNINASLRTGSIQYNPIKLLLGKDGTRCR